MIVCMRTNIVLNDELMREAMEYSSARTKKSLIEEALHAFIKLKASEQRKENYKVRLVAVQARTEKLKLRTPPTKLLREDRDRR